MRYALLFFLLAGCGDDATVDMAEGAATAQAIAQIGEGCSAPRDCASGVCIPHCTGATAICTFACTSHADCGALGCCATNSDGQRTCIRAGDTSSFGVSQANQCSLVDQGRLGACPR